MDRDTPWPVISDDANQHIGITGPRTARNRFVIWAYISGTGHNVMVQYVHVVKERITQPLLILAMNDRGEKEAA